MRCARTGRLVFLAVLGIVASMVMAAESSACSLSVHCYGYSGWSTTGTYAGGLSNVRVTRLTVPAAGSFATAEFWVSTNSKSCSSIGQSWVENGIEANEQGQRYWFWAEKSPTYGFSRHPLAFTPSLGTTYESKITYNNGNKYAVYRNGTFLSNTLAAHALYTNCFESGTESTYNGNQITGTNNGFQKKGASGNWSFNWGGAAIFSNPPVTASSTDPKSTVSYSQN